ncbi:sensor histidine kinase [Pseudonocardia xishanensis]|uniref:sensor histidine kinase n=1 Tax=Pseudonocardia xishanensis TaxID=630995 RepID=UPI0031EE12C7
MDSAPGTMRSLARQAHLVALACVLVDVTLFLHTTDQMATVVRVAVVFGIVCVDAAVAVSPRFSGVVAVVHAGAAVGFALVLQDLADANSTLAGGVIAAYRVGAWMADRRALAAVAVLVAGGMAAELLTGTTSALLLLTDATQDALLPWLVGRYTSARRGHVLELRHNRELEMRDATSTMERAAERQRASIARDLHDVIAHHVSAIGAHTGAARLRLAAEPHPHGNKVTASLAAAEASSRSAMTDLRRVLDVLHRTAQLPSQVGLADLDELIAGVHRSGLPVRLCTSGRPRDLPGSVDVALYRIAQEMLTNALRYGDGSPVELHLDHRDDLVRLTARNGTCPASAGPTESCSTGRGLAGIRSRAGLLGGTASYGPSPDGTAWETRVEIYIDVPVPTGALP